MSIKGEAVQRLASAAGDVAGAVARHVDDWGWKGGKPGELTGGMFNSEFAKTKDLFGNYLPGKQKLRQRLLTKAAKQLGDLANNDFVTVGHMMDSFAGLERAGVPRRWTGKIMRSIGMPTWEFANRRGKQLLGVVNDTSGRPHRFLFGEDIEDAISNTMRDLGDDKSRGAFLDILPAWGSSLDELGSLVAQMQDLPRLQQEFIRQSAGKLSERGMSTDQILNLARATFGG